MSQAGHNSFSSLPLSSMGFWFEWKHDAILAEAATELIGFTWISGVIFEVVRWAVKEAPICLCLLLSAENRMNTHRSMWLQPVLLGLSQMIQSILGSGLEWRDPALFLLIQTFFWKTFQQMVEPGQQQFQSMQSFSSFSNLPQLRVRQWKSQEILKTDYIPSLSISIEKNHRNKMF